MATSNPLKRLWKEYEKLKNWAASTDPAPTIFKVETSEDEIEMISSRPNNGGAAPAIQGEHISIVGLIYPSTAPFRQRGLRVEILVPAGYPQEPPVVYMRMRIRHPNIEKDGRICTVLLDPSKKYVAGTLADVVKIIVNLIDEPELGHVVDAEMGSLYETNIDEYKNMIMKMVTDHGVPRA